MPSASPAVFIDGEAGTTGLQIRDRLMARADLRLLSIAPERRKDVQARADLIGEADVVILCLPDAAATESVALIDAMGEGGPRIIDASTAHRVAPGWVYGFPELQPGQMDAVVGARRVTNPGCYPTGAIALLKPLVAGGLIPPDHPITINAVSGYSGGGRAMIESHDAGTAPAFELYGLGLEHKHLPELQLYAGLSRRPIFVPSVGRFRQGMLVSIPLHLDLLPGHVTGEAIAAAWRAWYPPHGDVVIADAADIGTLEPEALNGTNTLALRVFASPSRQQAVLVAQLDNLGKGASGAAVQCLDLMFGLARTA